MIYYVYYILVLFFSVVSFFTSKFKKKDFFLFNIAIVILCLISGFRYYIGPDYEAYIEIFEKSSTVSHFKELNKIHGEYLFLFINVFLAKLHFNYKMMFLLYSLLSLLLLKKIIENNLKKYYLYSLFIYLSFYFLRETMGIIRYSLASLLCIYSINLIKSEKILKFLLMICLATFIQSAALIFLPVYWLYNKNISKKIWVTLLFFSIFFYKINGIILIYNFFSKFIPLGINKKIYSTIYISKFGQNPGFSSYQLYLIITFIFLVFFKKVEETRKEINVYLGGVIIYFLFLNVAIYAARFSDIYLKISLILFPKIISEIKNKNFRLIIILFTLVVGAYIYTSQLNEKAELYFPYRNWLFL